MSPTRHDLSIRISPDGEAVRAGDRSSRTVRERADGVVWVERTASKKFGEGHLVLVVPKGREDNDAYVCGLQDGCVGKPGRQIGHYDCIYALRSYVKGLSEGLYLSPSIKMQLVGLELEAQESYKP